MKIIIRPDQNPQLILSEMLVTLREHSLITSAFFLGGIKKDDNDPTNIAMHTIIDKKLVHGAHLKEKDDTINILLDPDYTLTLAAKKILNPLNLHGSTLEQIHQLFAAVENGTISEITSVAYTDESIPNAISTVIEDGYISGFDKWDNRSTFYLFISSKPRITSKGYEFIQKQEGTIVQNTTNITNSQNTNVMNGENQSLISNNSVSIKTQASENLKKFSEATSKLSEDDQKIASEIKSDIQKGAIYPSNWNKFTDFFENHPEFTNLIGNLLVSATTIGTSFIH